MSTHTAVSPWKRAAVVARMFAHLSLDQIATLRASLLLRAAAPHAAG